MPRPSILPLSSLWKTRTYTGESHGFDGATFSEKHNGVQSVLKNSFYAVFVHCHCHLLQFACVQAANATSGIKHVYITLTTLWKYFHYSPKQAESLREVQGVWVLDPPELKIVKPTSWLAHEHFVKASYSPNVNTLNIYEQTHKPETLGISRALNCVSDEYSIMFFYKLPSCVELSMQRE